MVDVSLLTHDSHSNNPSEATKLAETANQHTHKVHQVRGVHSMQYEVVNLGPGKLCLTHQLCFD